MNLKKSRKTQIRCSGIDDGAKGCRDTYCCQDTGRYHRWYALSPIDLIPDFVPVLGYLDDVVL